MGYAGETVSYLAEHFRHEFGIVQESSGTYEMRLGSSARQVRPTDGEQ